MPRPIISLCVENRDALIPRALDILEGSIRTLDAICSLLVCDHLVPQKEHSENLHVVHNSHTIKSKQDYSKIVLASIPDYISSLCPSDDWHLLVCQTDGFIVNPDAWDDSWLEYDYIGAPWGLHPLHYIPPHPNVTEGNRVGNGGFSLRSAKLVREVKKIYTYMSIHMGHNLNGWWDPEDSFICRTIRPILEKQCGIKFAPLEIAEKFSVENDVYTGQFGFHGKIVAQQLGINV